MESDRQLDRQELGRVAYVPRPAINVADEGTPGARKSKEGLCITTVFITTVV